MNDNDHPKFYKTYPFVFAPQPNRLIPIRNLNELTGSILTSFEKSKIKEKNKTRNPLLNAKNVNVNDDGTRKKRERFFARRIRASSRFPRYYSLAPLTYIATLALRICENPSEWPYCGAILIPLDMLCICHKYNFDLIGNMLLYYINIFYNKPSLNTLHM